MEQGKEGLCILIPIDTFYKIRLWEWNGVSNIQSAEVGVKFFSVRLKSLEIQFYFSIDEKNSTGDSYISFLGNIAKLDRESF